MVFAWRDHDEYEIPADEVARIDRANISERRDMVSAAGSRVMSAATMHGGDPHQVHGLEAADHPGPAPKRIVTGYGFWIFILSDMVMFSCFFAAYAVLSGQTAGGPHGAELFNLKNVAIETALPVAVELHLRDGQHRGRRAQQVLVPDRDGGHLRAGAGVPVRSNSANSPIWSRAAPGRSRSAFLSSFFTLVGCHGLHVSAGILWLLTMMAQVFAKGFRADIQRRILCFALFWHALDIIWVAVFSVVYLLGSGA